MADISDITAYIASVASTAVYPNGNLQPSVTGNDVSIYEGWPISEQLNLDLTGQVLAGNPPVPVPRAKGPVSNVSIYPLPGGSSLPYQILDNTYTITPAAINLVVSVSGNQVTVTGTPAAGEILTLVVDRTYVYSQTGATASAILSALLTAVQINYPSATLVGSTLTVPYGYELDVRQGGIATLGKVSHRQIHPVMISVWAPDHVTRTTLAKAIDVAMKATLVAAMPDGSEALFVYSRTNVSDIEQNKALYRRDLIYNVEFATITTFPGTTITSVSNQITQEGALYNQPQLNEVT